jgi:hypothetical protein
MGLIVYLGSTIVPTPGDLDGFEQRIVRDFERRMIYSEAPATATFTGGAWRILRDQFLANFCASMPLRIYDDCTGVAQLLLSGEIILADIKWNLSRCTAEAAIQVASVGARILDNMELVISPVAETSKDGIQIAPCSSFALTVFDPQAPASTTTRAAYDWSGAMQHAVDFLTDGTVMVTNTWYSALPDEAHLALVQGVLWRTGTLPDDPVQWTLSDLWLEIAKRFNLWMVVRQDANGIASITILDDAGTYGQVASTEISHIDGIVQSIDSDALFGSVKVGERREANRTGSSYSALPYFRSVTHVDEQYGVSCLCNRGEALDLTCRWVADHGILEHVMWQDNTDTEIDEDVCLLQYVQSTATVTASAYLATAPLYNEAMLNYRVVNRYPTLCDVIVWQAASKPVLARNMPVLSNDPAILSGPLLPWYVEGSNNIGPLDSVPVSLSSIGVFDSWPLDAPPNGLDPGAQWNGVNRYTASATGIRSVSFRFRASVVILSGTSNLDPRRFWRMRLVVDHYTAANVLLGTYSVAGETIGSGSFDIQEGTTALFMQTGEYFLARIVPEIVLPIDFQTVLDLTFELSASAPSEISVSSLSFDSGTSGERRIALVEFERHVTTSSWMALLGDPRAPITIDGAGMGPTLSWVREASRDILRGNTRFTLMHSL